MITKFWDKLSEELAGRWTGQALGPALAFWGGGLLAWVSRYGWQPLVRWLESLGMGDYVALAVGGLLLLAASSSAAWLQGPVLRLAEGYWPRPFRGLRFALARRLEARLAVREARWQTLAAIAPEARTAEQEDEYARLDAELAGYPVDPRRLMPTRLGNLLGAAEAYPEVRYGLTTSVCWPRLWLLLPKETQETLAGARERLNSGARALTWGVLFVVWTVWAWWALPAALAAAAAAYWAMLGAAGVYGSLLRAAFDLHRFDLYKALHWPLPSRWQAEKPAPLGQAPTQGQALSEFLYRGLGVRDVVYEHPQDDEG